MRIYLLIAVLLFSSCSVFKESKKTSTTKEKEASVLIRDSIAKIETSQPIKDNIIINVPKSDNDDVNKALDDILNMLNTSKSSGNNSYSSRYDEETRQLVIDFLIGQTQNKETFTNSDLKIEKSFEQQTDEYVEKKIKAIPWWVWLLLAFWFLPSIMQTLGIILNPLKTLFSKIKS